MSGKILVVDDDRSIRKALHEMLEMEKYKVEEAVDGKEALNLLRAKSFDCVLCDIKMPKKDGTELLQEVMNEGIDVPFIMISGHGDIETAVETVRIGAFDYIPKPPDLNRLLITIRNAIDNGSLKQINKSLKKSLHNVQDIIGESEAIAKVKETIDKVAPTDARVLIIGDNGTGKELVAKWLHEKSNRSQAPLIEVNCAAIPKELIESELFGHEKGSFTGAVKQSIGKFEQADGGTLFLDEIGDMSPEAQAKVLRALQEGKITRIGGDKEISVNVRVISATNKNLLNEIEKDTFRRDLYFRLGVIIITVPPLNERKEDIPLLVNSFSEQICKDYGRKKVTFSEDALQKLMEKDWQGNIRELHNVVQRLIIFSDDTVTLDILQSHIS